MAGYKALVGVALVKRKTLHLTRHAKKVVSWSDSPGLVDFDLLPAQQAGKGFFGKNFDASQITML